MESKRYKKTPGGGVATFPASSEPASPSAPPPQPAALCTFVSAAGHRCHMLIVHPDSTLCPDHLNKQLRAEQRHTQSVANTLLENMYDFSSPDTVNVFLGNLLRELALKRIDRKDAIALAYIGQLLLNSHAAIERFNDNQDNVGSPLVLDLLHRKRELEIALYPREPQPSNPNANPTANPEPGSSP